MYIQRHCLQVQGTSCVCSAEFIVLRFFDNAEDIVIPNDLKEYLDDVVKTIDLVDVSKKLLQVLLLLYKTLSNI